MPTPHSGGLRFRKLDLHLHTSASKDFSDPSVSPDIIIERARASGLEGIAVTDHNTGAAIDALKEAGARVGVTVFPGVEITCSGGKEGLHIIALFDPACTRAHVEGLLSELGFHPEDYGDLNAVVDKNAIDVIEVIHRRGALAVLAHVNSTRGVFRDMTGQQRTNLIQHPFVSAAEATDFRNEDLQKRRKRAIDLLDGNDPVYKRAMAVYQASDNPILGQDGGHSVEGIGTRCAFFKMDNMNLDALRQCFADPEVRIRQDFEFREQTYPYIKSVTITGGYLDGANPIFHEGLNSILGAKGAGKSLLVEFMRFALDQPPLNDDILEDHNGKLNSRLEDYGSVELTVVDETSKPVVIRRLYDPAEGNPYQVPDRDDIAQLFPVLFLSQNEIIRIAESEDQQIGFIDRFFDFRFFQAEISALENELGSLDTDLAESLRASRELKDVEKRINQWTKEIASLDVALKNPVFDEYTKLELKDRSFREQHAYLTGIDSRFDRALRDLVGPTAPSIPQALELDPALRRAVERCNKAKETVKQAIESARVQVKTLLEKSEEEYRRWTPTFQDVRKRYEDATQSAGGDYKALAQKRAKMVKEVESLQARVRLLKDAAAQLGAIGGQRRALLTQVRAAYDKYTSERKARCQRIEAESNGKLKVRIHEASNVDEFRDRLMALKKGSHVRDADIERISSKVDPGDFMRAVIQFSLSANPAHLNDLAKKSGVEPARVEALAEFLLAETSYETLLALEYKAIPQDRPEIRYNLGGDNFELLERLSVGQKCTAMLMISLCEGTMPIIIDQPEDSLDLRTIWEDICLKVRKGKDRRQFIFTTHNSSVAVASDSDKFIIMEGGASKGQIVFSGSMDHQPVSAEALRYLEGGSQTYRTKYRKYRGEDIIG